MLAYEVASIVSSFVHSDMLAIYVASSKVASNTTLRALNLNAMYL